MTTIRKPHDKGMRKGILYAGANSRSRQYKETVINYIRKHFDVENISALQKKMVAEKFELSESTINAYLRELSSLVAELNTLSQEYPLPTLLFSARLQDVPYIQFKDVMALEIDLRTYQVQNIPKGYKTLRLDFKLEGKKPNTLELFMRDCRTGEKYKFVLFKNENEFKPKKGHIDFAECYLNGRFFEVEIYHNQAGYAIIGEATLL